MEKYYDKILKGYNWIKTMFDNDELTIDQFNCIQNLCNNFTNLCNHYLEIVIKKYSKIDYTRLLIATQEMCNDLHKLSESWVDNYNIEIHKTQQIEEKKRDIYISMMVQKELECEFDKKDFKNRTIIKGFKTTKPKKSRKKSKTDEDRI